MSQDLRLEQYYLRLRDIIGNGKDISPLIPLSRSQWLKGVNVGTFPPPLKISARILVWKSDDIKKLMEMIDKGTMHQLEDHNWPSSDAK